MEGEHGMLQNVTVGGRTYQKNRLARLDDTWGGCELTLNAGVAGHVTFDAPASKFVCFSDSKDVVGVQHVVSQSSKAKQIPMEE